MSLYVDIEKKLGDFLLKVEFEANDGVTALLGASGCGKSMTLKCIAGIEKPDKGKIILDGVTLFDKDKRINLSPQERKVGYLFQQYALFPNMTVEQNIATGVRKIKGKYYSGISLLNSENRDLISNKRKEVSSDLGDITFNKKHDKSKIVKKMLESMHLEEVAKLKPNQLSGGQQQRVALARILVNEPNALLLDEPFSALDSHLRFSMEREVRDIIASFGKTVLLVSHDRDEVFRLSDNIAIMDNGIVNSFGTRRKIFSDPGTYNGAVLTGCKNISKFDIIDDKRVYAKEWDVFLELPRKPKENESYLGIRMHSLKIVSKTSDANFINLEEAIDKGSIRSDYLNLMKKETNNSDLVMTKEKEKANIVDCKVVEVIENPFSFTVMLKPLRINSVENQKEEIKLFGIEVEKSVWEKEKSDILLIQFPKEEILILE